MEGQKLKTYRVGLSFGTGSGWLMASGTTRLSSCKLDGVAAHANEGATEIFPPVLNKQTLLDCMCNFYEAGLY